MEELRSWKRAGRRRGRGTQIEIYLTTMMSIINEEFPTSDDEDEENF